VSLDNRRLYCFKQFQMERSEDVMVSINVVELNYFLETFVCHMDEGNLDYKRDRERLDRTKLQNPTHTIAPGSRCWNTKEHEEPRNI
jgi:hypothetical protein